MNVARQFATEYCALPMPRVGTTLDINQIRVYNWDVPRRRPFGNITYLEFILCSPMEFKLGNQSFIDYMPNDYVSPVVIIDCNDQMYRVPYVLWSVFADIRDAMEISPSCTEATDLSVVVDSDYEWVRRIIKIVGDDAFAALAPQHYAHLD